MSEEEIIKTLKEMIEKSRDLMEEDFYKLIGIHQIQAITSLLDLYNKEKEKNKKLENADLTIVYMNGFYDGEKKWKDKINEKIADYTEKSQTPLVNSQSIREYTFGIRAFQRLLEERS